MMLQRDLTIIAASVGFVSAIFFSFGSISTGPEEICLQSTPYWDFSEPVARALSAQRAQNIVGSIFLVIAFLLQIAAVVVPSSVSSPLPQRLRNWFALVLSVFLIAISTGFFASRALEAQSTKKAWVLSKLSKSSTSQLDSVCKP
jgi:hypothetical protein